MSNLLAEDAIAVPSELSWMRRFPLDGALLCFDRRTGLTAICDGEETAELRMRAPRVVQFAITSLTTNGTRLTDAMASALAP